MTGPQIGVSGVPTGGAIVMQFPEYQYSGVVSGVSAMMIQRAVSGVSGIGAWTTIYSGQPQFSYVDAGDAMATPLLPTNAYVWRVNDSRAGGITQIGPITPAGVVTTQPDHLTNLFVRLLQGAINNTTLPTGFKLPAITIKMPQQGLRAMPFVVVNLDLIQQSQVQIGEDTPYFNVDNVQYFWANAKRIWRASVFCASAEERDFFRDTLLILYRVLKGTVFTQIGYNVEHSFQASSYTDPKEWEGHSPGFYGADLILEMDGVFSTAILTNFPIINEIDVTVNSSQNTGTINVPTNP